MIKVKKISLAILFLVILGIVILKISRILENKESRNKYQEFYQEKEEFDVLFLGSSHMMNGIYPMELWDEFGIVSYNLGQHYEYIPVDYWQLKNALQFHTPKLVVIDVYYIDGMTKAEGTIENLAPFHMVFDGMPFSFVKIQALKDLLPEDANPMEFLFNLTAYHERWSQLAKEDFSQEFIVEKGAEYKIGLRPVIPEPVIDLELKNQGVMYGKEYLKAIIELCQNEGIEILLTHLPYNAGAYKQTSVNSVYDIANEYQIDFLNFLTMPELIRYSTDLFDDGHLNPSGARKVTQFMGQYIQKKFSIDNRKKDERFQIWEEDLKKYHEFNQVRLRSNTIYDYLMLLYDKNMNAEIVIGKNSPYLMDEQIWELLKNLGAKEDFEHMINQNLSFQGFVVEWKTMKVDWIEDTAMELNVQIKVFNEKTGELIDEVIF